jgi:MFS transporter, DHA3 family, macrolide efflux protein
MRNGKVMVNMINRNFTLLWLGKIISQLGDKFYAIALAWWILQKTNSPSIMGLFLLTSVLPGILLGFFAGALTDRWKRKTMLVVTDIIRGCLVLIISYMSMNNALEIWHVFGNHYYRTIHRII